MKYYIVVSKDLMIGDQSFNEKVIGVKDWDSLLKALPENFIYTPDKASAENNAKKANNNTSENVNYLIEVDLKNTPVGRQDFQENNVNDWEIYVYTQNAYAPKMWNHFLYKSKASPNPDYSEKSIPIRSSSKNQVKSTQTASLKFTPHYNRLRSEPNGEPISQRTRSKTLNDEPIYTRTRSKAH